MEAIIKLTRFVSQDESLPMAIRQAWPVQILAEGTNMDDNIFVYHVGSVNDPIPGDRFECVASVNQMHEIPKNQGVSLTTQTLIPYYRANVLDYVARSATEADEIWQKVQVEVDRLVKNWNSAMKLTAIDFVEISETLITTKDVGMQPPVRIQLSYHPAGTPGTDVNGKPIISVADPTKSGWLPSQLMGLGGPAPPGGKFYYNISKDSNLYSSWPPKQPFSGNQLHRNGIQMPYGLVWTLTEHTVWWMDFDPATIPGYKRVGGNEDWGAPWPIDYVSQANPGSVSNLIHLTLFK